MQSLCYSRPSLLAQPLGDGLALMALAIADMDLPGTGTVADASEMSARSSTAKVEAVMRSAGRFVSHSAAWCHDPREADIAQRSPQPGCPPFSAFVILRGKTTAPSVPRWQRYRMRV